MRETWRVVIVDDSSEDREEIRRCLLHGSQRRYLFSEAQTGSQGVEALLRSAHELPHVAIVDYNLPDMNAFQALEALVDPVGLPPCPIVVLTGSSGHEMHAGVLRAGGQDYIGKAWMTPESLTRTIENARERHILLRELRDANRRKDVFLATLAHELRNPLAPIRNAIELLRTVSASDHQLNKLRDILARQVAHLTRLVDDLLDVSRVTQGKVNLRKDALEIGEIVQAALELTHPQFDAKSHRLDVTLSREPLFVWGDSERLVQVIGNLLNNAAKYTESGGKIDLTIERALHADGENVVVRVRDNGPGIAPDILPHVFELFTQAERSLDRAEGGLGVGLSLVKSLIELHGGKVHATSTGIGQGSEFGISLPRIAAPSRQRQVVSQPQAPTKPRRVLIVDDNVDSAETLGALLELDGHTVHYAFDGQAGLEAALTLLPDVALLDIGMPKMDGYELARQLRSAPETSKALIVALTGYGQKDDHESSRSAGFDFHLLKPVDLGVLSTLIAKVETA